MVLINSQVLKSYQGKFYNCHPIQVSTYFPPVFEHDNPEQILDMRFSCSQLTAGGARQQGRSLGLHPSPTQKPKYDNLIVFKNLSIIYLFDFWYTMCPVDCGDTGCF